MDLTIYDRFRPYKGCVIPNFLARDVANARNVYEASGRSALIGVMTAHFDDTTECIDYVLELLKVLPAVSLGLGDGQPSQWSNVVEVARATNPGHINQVFPAAGFTAGVLAAQAPGKPGQSDRPGKPGRPGRPGKPGKNMVNALIRPTGTPGKVVVSTGPFSAEQEPAVVSADTAAAMLADVGIPSVKFFPIAGDTRLPEVAAMAKAAAARGVPVFEPTGGLTERNVASVIKVCLDAGAQWVIPHLYSSMIDKVTGLTAVRKVERVMEELDRVLG